MPISEVYLKIPATGQPGTGTGLSVAPLSSVIHYDLWFLWVVSSNCSERDPVLWLLSNLRSKIVEEHRCWMGSSFCCTRDSRVSTQRSQHGRATSKGLQRAGCWGQACCSLARAHSWPLLWVTTLMGQQPCLHTRVTWKTQLLPVSPGLRSPPTYLCVYEI